MNGNEENIICDSSWNFGFIDVCRICAKREGAAVYGGLVAYVSS
jgi:hypothetical protein